MFNIIFEQEYAAATRLITRIRREAHLSQRAMAMALQRSQGHIHRMETRQRPIELVEFCRIARASGADPAEVLRRLLEDWTQEGCDYLARRPEPEIAAAE